MLSSGLPGVSIQISRVSGVIAASTAAASLASTWVIFSPAVRSRTRWNRRHAPPYKIVGGDHMRALIEQFQHGGLRRQSGREGEARRAAFEFGERCFERGAGRIAGARIFPARMRRPASIARRSSWRKIGGLTAPVKGSGCCRPWIARVCKPRLCLSLSGHNCPLRRRRWLRRSMRVIRPRKCGPSTMTATKPLSKTGGSA